MTKTVEVAYECELCNELFLDEELDRESDDNLGWVDSEFRFHPYDKSTGVDLLPLFPKSCPLCRFTENYDISPMRLTDDEKASIYDFLEIYPEGKICGYFSQSQKCEVMTSIRKLTKYPARGIAASYLTWAWMVDDERRPYFGLPLSEKGKELREETIKYLIKALENNEYSPKDEAGDIQKTTYLIGELNRRLERFEEALEWFSKVKPEEMCKIEFCDYIFDEGDDFEGLYWKDRERMEKESEIMREILNQQIRSAQRRDYSYAATMPGNLAINL